MFTYINFGPPVLDRDDDLPDGILLLEDGAPLLLESGEPLLLE